MHSLTHMHTHTHTPYLEKVKHYTLMFLLPHNGRIRTYCRMVKPLSMEKAATEHITLSKQS